MKKTNSLFYHILIFVLAQLAWFSLLGLWIYWYVSNYIIITKVGEKLALQNFSLSPNVFALVSGLILLVMISVGMSLIFIYLTRQVHLTHLYNNFIANVTHELKSPLASVQLYLETLNAREVPRRKQREFIGLMLNDVSRLHNLINSILYLSGLEQKKAVRKYPHDYHVYQADQIFRELISEAADQQKLPPGSVDIEGQADCQCVLDRNWMRIVFDNLLDNARKYSVNPAKISVRISCTKKRIQLEISDQGLGIPLKDQKKIFQKFQRVDTPDSPSVKGTGLGLYWVKEIIGYHGGKVSVNSKGLGHGSTFKIELPVYQAAKKRLIKNLLKRSKNKMENANE